MYHKVYAKKNDYSGYPDLGADESNEINPTSEAGVFEYDIVMVANA